MRIYRFRVYYTPTDKPIDPNNISYKLVKATSIPEALDKFNAQYTNSRALYVTKNWGGLT